MAHDVFISHAPTDQGAAERLYAALQVAGIRCRIASRNVPAGATAASLAAIDESRLVILVWSKGSRGAADVLAEIGWAERRGIPIVGVRLEPLMPAEEPDVAAIRWVTGVASAPGYVDELVETVRGVLGRKVNLGMPEVAPAPQVARAPQEAPPSPIPVPREQLPNAMPAPRSSPSKALGLPGLVAGAIRRGIERLTGGRARTTSAPPDRGVPAPPVRGAPPPPDRGVLPPPPAGAAPREPVPVSTEATQPDPVFLATTSPRSASPGDRFTVDVVAYVKRAEPEVKSFLLQGHAPDEINIGRKTGCRWPVGTTVVVRLAAQHLVVQPATRELTWDGEWAQVTFVVEVPANATARRTTLDGSVHVAGVCVADFSLQVDITARPTEAVAPAAPAATQTIDRPIATSAFASYSSKDRDEVLRRLSSIRASTGLDIFVDCVSLRAGESWAPALEREIAARDRFLLFWCRHAHDSEWVRREYELALRLKGARACEIHPLEPVGRDLIPEPLQHLHFGDVFLYAAGYDPNHPEAGR